MRDFFERLRNDDETKIESKCGELKALDGFDSTVHERPASDSLSQSPEGNHLENRKLRFRIAFATARKNPHQRFDSPDSRKRLEISIKTSQRETFNPRQ